MSRDRSRTVARRKARQQQATHERRERIDHFVRVLKMMGLNDYLEGLDRRVIAGELAKSAPRISVHVVPALASVPELEGMARSLRRTLDRVMVRVDGGQLHLQDFLSLGLRYVISRPTFMGSQGPIPSHPPAPARAGLDSFCDRFEDLILSRLEDEILDLVVHHSRLDGPIYTASLGLSQVGAKFGLTIELNRTDPKVVTVALDGVRRRAYRCGLPTDLETGEVVWASWDTGDLGWGAPERLPVFIQSHAILQARGRLGVPPSCEPLLHHHVLGRALSDPRLVLRDEARCLIGVGPDPQATVGYLVAERLPGMVLVRTFLLATMQGTPEAERLYRRLGLGRRDVEYLGLDDIAMLTSTDLLDDEQIVAALEDCGCGGFIRLIKQNREDDHRPGHSARFRGYLGRNFTRLLAELSAAPSSPEPE